MCICWCTYWLYHFLLLEKCCFSFLCYQTKNSRVYRSTSVCQQLHIYPSLNLALTLTCYQLNKGGKFLKKLWCLSVGEYNRVIWTELIIGHRKEFQSWHFGHYPFIRANLIAQIYSKMHRKPNLVMRKRLLNTAM